jgi:predicted O-linked N-acetylglucosamine transferase (SPINDLY family)
MSQSVVLQKLQAALTHFQAKRFPEAESLCREALSIDSASADAIGMLGLIAYQAGNPPAAIDLLNKAISLQPQHAKFHNDLGLVLSAIGKTEQAVKAFEEAIRLRANYAEAFNNLGTVLKRRQRLDDAITAYERATQLSPEFAEAFYNLGNCLKERGRLDDAVEAYRRALAIRPGFAEALCNAGTVLKDVGRQEEAVQFQKRAVEIMPDPGLASTYLCTLQFDPSQSIEHILEEHARWDRTYAQPLSVAAPPHTNDPSPDRKLRLGYISPDLCLHPVAYCLMPVFRNHDHSAYEVYGYCDVDHPDAVTSQFRSHIDVWRDTRAYRDAQLADLVRSDKIDVLIDLAGHSNGNRLMAFARKPAPVRINWLGWPGTTGMESMFRISDRYIDHPNVVFRDKTMYMPDSFWCFDPMVVEEVEAQVNPLPALTNGYITFGCTNNFGKITGLTLDLWSAILSAVPKSRLLLRAPTEQTRQRVLDRIAQSGVGSARIEFATKLPRQQYWELYNRIDINLDATPYNGHVTTMDSAYMGVPMVSLAGGMPLARAGFSILSNLGLCELVAHDPQTYVRIAVELANNLPRLSDLRAILRDRIKSSALMDAPRFTRNIEALYRQAWRQWCASQSSPAA